MQILHQGMIYAIHTQTLQTEHCKLDRTARRAWKECIALICNLTCWNDLTHLEETGSSLTISLADDCCQSWHYLFKSEPYESESPISSSHDRFSVFSFGSYKGDRHWAARLHQIRVREYCLCKCYKQTSFPRAGMWAEFDWTRLIHAQLHEPEQGGDDFTRALVRWFNVGKGNHWFRAYSMLVYWNAHLERHIFSNTAKHLEHHPGTHTSQDRRFPYQDCRRTSGESVRNWPSYSRRTYSQERRIPHVEAFIARFGSAAKAIWLLLVGI
jgi:hypothetical protein